jgi:hypothetical protein
MDMKDVMNQVRGEFRKRPGSHFSEVTASNAKSQKCPLFIFLGVRMRREHFVNVVEEALRLVPGTG